MTYAKYLIDENDLLYNYSEQWSNGGTYGTCWDVDGPSNCSYDTPIDYSNYAD